MKKAQLNREYALRHLFTTVLMAAFCLWFGYDGLVRYPATPGAELYREIEKSDPPEGFDVESFKRQKRETQIGLSLASLAAFLIVGLRLLNAARFKFAFDETTFSINGQTWTKDDIASIDRSRWAKKSILTLHLKNGRRVTLDAWHHTAVKEFEQSPLATA